MPEAPDQRLVVQFYYRSFAFDIGLLSGTDLSRSRLSDDDPLEIRDLAGQPLFLHYDILGEDGTAIGTLRSSARGDEMPLIDAITLGAPPSSPADLLT
jgi:hypothetical protein